MKPRRFYLPSEIPQVTQLLESELFDAVHRKQLPVCALIEATDLGVSGKGESLLGTFDYNGYIRLSLAESKQLLCDKKKVDTNLFGILEPELITEIKDCREKFAHLTHSNFSRIGYLSDVPEREFLATPSVAEISDHRRGNKTAYNKMLVAKETGDGAEVLNSFLSAFTPKETMLGYHTLTIKPEQLRFDIREITKVFGDNVLLSNTRDPKKPTETIDEVKDSHIETHPIKLIISRMLTAYPSYGPAKLWNLLRKDVEQGLLKYDIDQVIDSINADEIEWFGRNINDTRLMTHKTFQNYIYQVKAEMK